MTIRDVQGLVHNSDAASLAADEVFDWESGSWGSCEAVAASDSSVASDSSDSSDQVSDSS